jgi:formate hydrogenlyase subunit 3/multisubunit Na+/H+ antiporter MnhD subunit
MSCEHDNFVNRVPPVLPLTGVVLSLDPLGAVFVVTTAVVGAAASC